MAWSGNLCQEDSACVLLAEGLGLGTNFGKTGLRKLLHMDSVRKPLDEVATLGDFLDGTVLEKLT